MEKIKAHFFISGEEKEIAPGSELWELPLSGRRTKKNTGFQAGKVNQGTGITIGDYFSASCKVLSQNECSILLTGLEAILKRPVSKDHVCRVLIFLEKHGAFYHPLKIRVELTDSQSLVFVLNGAVSTLGLSLIETEYFLISRLNKAFSKQYLPHVFGLNFVETNHGRIGFFLGEWFEGYKEFHVTDAQDQRQIVIWESDGRCRYLPGKTALPIYQETARILTYYYNIETFEQIFPWHHAAGDFIVQQSDGRFHIRLITVRGYSPLTEFGSGKEDKKSYILPSLLFFFFNLTIRMRLDRLDGTGKTVLLEDEVIGATIKGFLTALDEKSKEYDYGDLKLIFIDFVKEWNPDQMKAIMATIQDSCDTDVTENQLILENLEIHCRIIETIFKTL